MAFGDSSAELSNQQLNCVLCGSAANSGHLSGSRRIDINVRELATFDILMSRHSCIPEPMLALPLIQEASKGTLALSYALTLELLANTSGNCRRYKK